MGSYQGRCRHGIAPRLHSLLRLSKIPGFSATWMATGAESLRDCPLIQTHQPPRSGTIIPSPENHTCPWCRLPQDFFHVASRTVATQQDSAFLGISRPSWSWSTVYTYLTKCHDFRTEQNVWLLRRAGLEVGSSPFMIIIERISSEQSVD